MHIFVSSARFKFSRNGNSKGRYLFFPSDLAPEVAAPCWSFTETSSPQQSISPTPASEYTHLKVNAHNKEKNTDLVGHATARYLYFSLFFFFEVLSWKGPILSKRDLNEFGK